MTQSTIKEYVFTLYYIESAEVIAKIQDLEALLDDKMEHPWKLQTINVLEHPEKAIQNEVFATPTLIRNLPEPVRRFIVNMAKIEEVFIEIS